MLLLLIFQCGWTHAWIQHVGVPNTGIYLFHKSTYPISYPKKIHEFRLQNQHLLVSTAGPYTTQKCLANTEQKFFIVTPKHSVSVGYKWYRQGGGDVTDSEDTRSNPRLSSSSFCNICPMIHLSNSEPILSKHLELRGEKYRRTSESKTE